MDEDGFFMGELNGVRGLVPSNFLQLQVENNNINTSIASITNSQLRPKGVVFSGEKIKNKKSAPICQTSQTSTTGNSSLSNNNNINNLNKNCLGTSSLKFNKTIKGSANVSSSNENPNKVLVKKSSDLTSKSIGLNNPCITPSKKMQTLKKSNCGSGVKVKFKFKKNLCFNLILTTFNFLYNYLYIYKYIYTFIH